MTSNQLNTILNSCLYLIFNRLLHSLCTFHGYTDNFGQYGPCWAQQNRREEERREPRRQKFKYNQLLAIGLTKGGIMSPI